MNEARAAAFAAHAAARVADHLAARAAATAARFPDAAIHTGSATATAEECAWQYEHLPKHLRPVALPA